MANGILPVDFRDDILSEDMNNRRRYQMITNSDGTVSFEDVTKYDQVGSNFGQAQINATNKAVNGLADSIGDAFSEEKTYAVGEYAIYDNALYEFTAAKAAGPWDPDVAALTTIADALSELNGNLTVVSLTEYDTSITMVDGSFFSYDHTRKILSIHFSSQSTMVSTVGNSSKKIFSLPDYIPIQQEIVLLLDASSSNGNGASIRITENGDVIFSMNTGSEMRYHAQVSVLLS